MEPLLFIVLLLILAKMGTELWLESINRAHVRAHADSIPEALRSSVDEATYKRSREYTLARSQFSTISTLWQTAWLCLLITTPLLATVYMFFQDRLGTGAGAPLSVMLSLMVLGLPDLVWDWWDHFKLEQRFGFNKFNLKLWISDKIKELLLSIAIGYPLLWIIFQFIRWQGDFWWISAWAITVAFILLMTFLGPVLLMPIFNKFTPLPEGELRTRLLALAKRMEFGVAAIDVMDGSKRSAHSNAFFTGFGSTRKIALFDTLIDQLEPEELEAVVAHEIGHFKCGHIKKRIALMIVMLLIAFAAIGWLMTSPQFVGAFGFEAVAGQAGPVFLLFMLLSGVITFWKTPLDSISARRHEYEADAYALKAMGTPAPLISALRKLHVKNLGNLYPHPWYSRFYYTHPTILEREAALLKGKKGQ